ncbi:hypothetical protein TRFO_11515 [Tritrichomonas foetus]|uniref:Uncharacterized protein n=1 Tax=Tritrichomonas foetus TaxID=1144522 RepID=A0A1J4J4W5_9EUKA|nr:hypothetical protein TRFO_11515 [Tritrichomonas foetus]|eukprot:OHS93745.1 hypothetical protein TRFO_11515 [Tritrichomonas foetus]
MTLILTATPRTRTRATNTTTQSSTSTIPPTETQPSEVNPPESESSTVIVKEEEDGKLTIDQETLNEIKKNNNTIYTQETGANKTITFNDGGANNIYFQPKVTTESTASITFEKQTESSAPVQTGVIAQPKVDTTVNIESPNINLNVKGEGTLTLQTSDKAKVPEFKVASGSLKGEEVLTIQTGDKIPVVVEELDLYSSPQFIAKSGSNVTVKTINVQQRASPKIENCKIESKITTGLSSTLTLGKNVDISSADVTVTYNQYATPSSSVFAGNLTSPPKSIQLQSLGLGVVLEASESEKTLTIADNLQDCKSWKNALDLSK